jgi:hypothetical protein
VADQFTENELEVTDEVYGEGVPGGDGTVADPVAVPDCLATIEPFADAWYAPFPF